MNEILTEDIQKLEEGPLGKALGTAAVAGAIGLGGHGAYKTIDQLSNIDTSQPAKVAQAPASAKKDFSKIDVPAMKAEPQKQKKAEAGEYKPITGSKNEAILAKVAQASGIKGVELAAFMSQMAHESSNFGDMVENNPNVKKYLKIKSLGNKNMNDAERFIGRGFIQLTGRWNYKNMEKKLGIDLTSTWSAAHKAADPKIAAQIAVQYWKDRVQPNVDDFTNVAAVTKKINPGLNGLDDRSDKFDKIMQNMEIEA